MLISVRPFPNLVINGAVNFHPFQAIIVCCTDLWTF